MQAGRREFLKLTAAGLLGGVLRGAAEPALRVGVTDWDLRQTGSVAAVELAARIGFDGLEVSLGRKLVEERLPLDNVERQAAYVEASRKHGITLCSTCLDALHTYFLKSDKLAPRLLADAIRINRQMGIRTVLAPMFGKGVPASGEEFDYVGSVLRELGPEAEKSGVVIAIENPLSAQYNARILEAARSGAVKVYYDTGNSAAQGYNVVQEIRWLGPERIAQVHFKDGKDYLGEGKIDFVGVMNALVEIGYQGFIVLETPSPSGSIEADMKRNLDYVRRLIEKVVRRA